MITDWTSEGIDWDEIEGKFSPPLYIEALRLALLERASVAIVLNTQVTLLAIPEILEDPIESGVFTQGDWATAFRDLVKEVYVLYLDHRNGVDGQDLKAWDEATIFDAIGQERIGPLFGSMRGVFITAEWARQQYDLINLMLWGYSTQVLTIVNGTGSRQGNSTVFATAVANWGAASYSTGDGGATEIAHWVYLRSPLNNLFVIRRKRSFYRDQPLITVLPKTWHVVMKIREPSTIPAFVDGRPELSSQVYENTDFPLTQDTHRTFIENNSVNTDASTGTFAFGDLPTVTVTEPAFDEQRGWHVTRLTDFDTMILYKWDVAGGFAFLP